MSSCNHALPLNSRSPLLTKLFQPPPHFPPVKIPEHLLKRANGLGKRERLLLWWLVYRLPVLRNVDTAAIQEAALETGISASRIEEIGQENPIHWERMLLKRRLRREHYEKHGSVPDGVTPGWPLGRNVTQLEAKLWRRKMHPNNQKLGLKQLRTLLKMI